MARSMEKLQQLAAEVRDGDPTARQRFRQELEPGLVHLVRHAMRTGTGKVARWVGRAVVAGGGPAEDPTPALASMLSAGIVQQLAADPSRAAVETVLGG